MEVWIPAVLIGIGALLTSYSVSFDTLRKQHPKELLPEQALGPHSVSWWVGNVLEIGAVLSLFRVRWYAALVGFGAALAAGSVFHVLWLKAWARRWLRHGLRLREWLRTLPEEFRPTRDEQIVALEHLRQEYGIDAQTFCAFILQSEWYTRRLQFALYQRDRRDHPALADREVLKELILSRSDRRIPLGISVTDEEIEKLLNSAVGLEQVVGFLVQKDREDAPPDPSGVRADIERRLSQIMER